MISSCDRYLFQCTFWFPYVFTACVGGGGVRGEGRVSVIGGGLRNLHRMGIGFQKLWVGWAVEGRGCSERGVGTGEGD